MFEGNFQVQAPGGLYSEGLIHGGAYFRNFKFTVRTEKDKEEWGLVRRGVVVSGHFLSLMLIGVVVFGVHFESDCTGFKCARGSFLRPWELGVCLGLLPDSTTRHLRVVIYYYRFISLQ